MIEIKLKVDTQVLDTLKLKLLDTEPLMAGISEELNTLTIRNFVAEGDPKWKDLKKSTITSRLKRHTWPGKKLQDSHRLINSIHPKHSLNEASIAASTVYAAIHQFGGEAGRSRNVKIPARPYMPITGKGAGARLNPDAERSITKICMHYFLL